MVRTWWTEILFAVVSREHGASQSFISRRLGNNKYSSKKAIVRRIHVDQTGENIWGWVATILLIKSVLPHCQFFHNLWFGIGWSLMLNYHSYSFLTHLLRSWFLIPIQMMMIMSQKAFWHSVLDFLNAKLFPLNCPLRFFNNSVTLQADPLHELKSGCLILPTRHVSGEETEFHILAFQCK